MKKKTVHRKKRIVSTRKTKRSLLHGDSTPLIIGVVMFIGIIALGGVMAANAPKKPAPTPAPTSAAAFPTDTVKLQMQTFYVSPVPSPSCTDSITDTMIIFDRSRSMQDKSKLTKAKAAAQAFIDKVAVNPNSRVGLSVFSNESTLASPLTHNFAAVKSAISALQTEDRTCIQCGIKTGNDEIAVNRRPEVKQNAIILTDGKANRVIGNPDEINDDRAKTMARDEALQGFSTYNITYYTIGFGDVDKETLQEIATRTGGVAYITPDESSLDQFFTQIAQQICN